MSSTYKITHDEGITRVDFSRNPTKDEMYKLLDILADMPDTKRRLFVMEKAEVLLSTAEVREGAEFARKKQNQPSRVAMVAAGSITYGISRIFKVFRESEQTQFGVFRDVDEALEWLKSDRPAPED